MDIRARSVHANYENALFLRKDQEQEPRKSCWHILALAQSVCLVAQCALEIESKKRFERTRYMVRMAADSRALARNNHRLAAQNAVQL